MKFKIRKSEDIYTILALNDEIFPEDLLDACRIYAGWVCYDEDKKPSGFCTISKYGDDICFMSRAGLLSGARGYGLHRRLIRVRESYARKEGFKYLITYTMVDNYSSFCNLIKYGYEAYSPEYAYAGENVLYLRKRL